MVTAIEQLEEPSENEAAEPAVEAVPRISRAALGYLEPRVGLDGLSMYGKCGSCQNYVAEANMNGAVVGSRCAIYGSNLPVSDDACCDRYLPWGSGLPCQAVTDFFAIELRKRYPGALSPSDGGYKEERSNNGPQCRGCRFVDMGDYGGERVECELYEDLNAKAPLVFDLDKAVKPYGRCNLWTRPPDPSAEAMY